MNKNAKIHTVPRSGTWFLINLMNLYTNSNDSKRQIRHYYIKAPTPKFRRIFPFERINANKIEKIAFVYRNPLDQAVSLYDHSYPYGKDFKYQKQHEQYYGSCNSAFDLATSFVPVYVTMYLSHLYFQEKHPQKIVLCSYERIQKKPFEALSEIITLLEGSLDAEKLKSSLEQCSISQLKNKELKNKKTLGGDLAYQTGVSHMADGKMGKWKNRFTAEETDKIFQVYAKYDIDISKFDGISEFV